MLVIVPSWCYAGKQRTEIGAVNEVRFVRGRRMWCRTPRMRTHGQPLVSLVGKILARGIG
eukprot:XP_001689781.1 predicted protein [Chlamydomonas reinhardtii]